MSQTPKILAFSGSTRKESYNQKLVVVAASMAENHGAEVTVVSLSDYPMPLFDEDLEADAGMPEHAQKFKELLLDHDGLLLACPEYNSTITPVLKNAIDWASRRAEGEGRLAAYQGKVVSLLAASPGALGGLRGLVAVRSLFGNIGATVLPKQYALGNAHQAFDSDGKFIDSNIRDQVNGVALELVSTTRALL